MLRALAANVSTAATTFPPLPHVPEPAIFDPSYAAKLNAILSDAGFPPNTPPQKIYLTRLKVIEAILASRKESAHSISINLMVAFVSMALLCVFLLVRIRRNRQRALLGDTAAARKIVLPAFEPMLWLLGGLNVSLVVAFGTLLLTGDVGDYYFRVTIELAIAIKMLNGLLVVMYMLQPSLSVRALSAALGKALVLSMYTVPVVVVLNAVATRHNQRACYWTLLFSRLLVGIYLVRLATYPPTRASILSIRLLCLYVVGMLLSLTWMNEAYHRGQAETARILGWAIAVYSAVLPLSVWHVLRADTEHWRGIGKRAVELQDTFRRKSGRIEERVSSQGLHVLIEMHRKFIIDFARLEIYEPIPGTGSSDRTKSVVYRGFLHTKKTPVAIKVYMPSAFTEDVVAAFSHEAALCGALVHPNIVKFHGLCVCPPNICLVTELCQASLYDVKHTQAAQLRRGQMPSRRRQQLLVDLGYMIDAARALAYLHSFSPPFVHRDIQPSSFLVDDEGTVKLTDFGASRTLSVRDTSGHRSQRVHRTVDTASTTDTHTRTSLDGRAAVLEVSSRQHYMAPEVVRGQQVGSLYHGEAADIFSLAVTMWDVLHPGQTKFPRSQQLMSDAEIAERVAAGHRPLLDPNIHVGLKELIDVMWHADARMRPSAQTIVSSLEAIQEELCAAFALEFMNGLHRTARLTSTGTMDDPKNFMGTQAVERMRLWDSVGSESEAIRLGNMLMDCGFVHHTKHARSFEHSSAQYMFDASQVLACQPLALLESDYETSGLSRVDDEATHHTERGGVVAKAVPVALANQRRSVVSSVDEYATGRARSGSNGSSRALMEMRCACRKLGQRIETERSTQSRFRFKFKLFGDESQQLTAHLLADDPPSALSMGMGHFEALHEPVELQGDRRGGKGSPGVAQIV